MTNAERIDLERRIVRALIQHMKQAGFAVTCIFDSVQHVYPATEDQAVAAVFAVDEASLRFVLEKNLPAFDKKRRVKERPSAADYDGFHAGGEWSAGEHGVLLVLGNGIDVISDWNYHEDDRDGFNKAMDAFDVYQRFEPKHEPTGELPEG